EQIERRILRGKLTEDEQAELWDSLYLTMSEVEALLAHVKSNGSIIRERQKFFPWVFPMFCFAAYTGARLVIGAQKGPTSARKMGPPRVGKG
ncbi:MAG: hypothetical protein WAK26_07200, partial [Terracidiphilus sp.]